MNIIIDYYSEDEKKEAWYKQILEMIEQTDVHHSVQTPCEFREKLIKYDMADIQNIIIFSHGYHKEDLIVHSELWSNAIYYNEIIAWLNNTLNGEKIKLDLSATCNSFRSSTHIMNLDDRFSEVITVNTVTPSYQAPFEIVKQGYKYWIDTRYEDNKTINPYQRILLSNNE